MARVLVVGPIRPEGVARLDGHEVVETTAPSAELLADAEAVLIRTQQLGRDLLDAAPRLRVVSRHGVGFDNVDVVALTERRIPLAVAATANAQAVAEHAFWMLMELTKDGRASDRAVRAGDWAARHRLVPVELAGRTLLLVGLGRVGRLLARRALAFDMGVAAFDPNLSPAEIKQAGCVPVAGLMTGLRDADAVSLHLPLTPSTRGLIGAEELAAMRPDAVLVNTARGGLIDETVLADALRAGRLRGAGLDVFEAEPPPIDHPLLACPNALLTPHVAGTTDEAMVRMAVEAADNVNAALAGRLDPSVCVNREVL